MQTIIVHLLELGEAVQSNNIGELTSKNLEVAEKQRIIDSDKQLLSEDLLFSLVKTLNIQYPRQCSRMILNPKIAKKLM